MGTNAIIIRLRRTPVIDRGIAAARDLRLQFSQLVAGEVPAARAAAAFAVGTVVSTIPLPFVDVALGAAVLRLSAGRLPRLPIVAAMAIWNNLIMAPLYLATPRLGAAVLGTLRPGADAAAWLPAVLVGYALIVALLTGFAYGLMRLGLPLLRARAGGWSFSAPAGDFRAALDNRSSIS